jgi:hypothetical protein
MVGGGGYYLLCSDWEHYPPCSLQGMLLESCGSIMMGGADKGCMYFEYQVGRLDLQFFSHPWWLVWHLWTRWRDLLACAGFLIRGFKFVFTLLLFLFFWSFGSFNKAFQVFIGYQFGCCHCVFILMSQCYYLLAKPIWPQAFVGTFYWGWRVLWLLGYLHYLPWEGLREGLLMSAVSELARKCAVSVVCMDLLLVGVFPLRDNRNDGNFQADKIIALGNGLGTVTVLGLVRMGARPQTQCHSTWLADHKWQLLGVFFCKSLGRRFSLSSHDFSALDWQLL